MNIYTYALSVSVVEYQTAILRGDLDAAAEILPSIPQDQRNRIARFLETQDLKELALSVSTDPDQRFDLAVSLDDLETALSLVRAADESAATPSGDAAGDAAGVGAGVSVNQAKWKVVGDKALAAWQMDLAKEAFQNANDLSSLLLLYTSLSDRTGLSSLAQVASQKGLNNLAFAAYLQLGDVAACIDLLVKTDRLAEAALFTRSYAPLTKETEKEWGATVKLWKEQLTKDGRGKVAEKVAEPGEDRELFN